MKTQDNKMLFTGMFFGALFGLIIGQIITGIIGLKGSELSIICTVIGAIGGPFIQSDE